MSTVLDIVTRAHRVLNLTGANESPSSAAAAKALVLLNAMALGWEADNLHTGWATVALSDDFPLEAKHEEGVTYLLVRRIAGDRGMQVTPVQNATAETGFSRLVADYKSFEGLRVDPGLSRLPSQRRWGFQL